MHILVHVIFFIISSAFSIISCCNFHEVAWFNIIIERRPYRTALVQYNMYISYNTTNLFKTGAAGFFPNSTDSETVPANARQKQIKKFSVQSMFLIAFAS